MTPAFVNRSWNLSISLSMLNQYWLLIGMWQSRVLPTLPAAEAKASLAS